MLATPALLLLVTLVIQFALWQHASHVVTTAAQEGAAQAQVEGGSVAAGRAGARRFLARSGGVVRAAEVSVSRTPERTRVVVRGRVVTLVPGFGLPVVGVADGPSERFLPRTER